MSTTTPAAPAGSHSLVGPATGGEPRGVIGVLGGMGPAATADFYGKLVRLAPAARDQDHPKVIIWADPTVPDRSLALLGQGPDPSEWLIRGAAVLRAAGATVLAIPCNTAHAFLPAISAKVGLPVVHMIDETARYLRGRLPDITTAGVLATTGTVRTGLYQDWLGRTGIEVLTPTESVQATLVMRAIAAIKSGETGPDVTEALRKAGDELIRRGAQAVIAGCTEVPLGLSNADAAYPVIDPTTVLAQAMLERVGVTPAH